MKTSMLRWILHVSLLVLILTSGCVTPISSTPLQTATILSPTLAQLSPSPTAQPTLTAAKAKEIILHLLKNNGGCQLPCIWGITPAITDLDSLNEFLSSYGEVSISGDIDVGKYSKETVGFVSFILWNYDIRVPISFSYEKDKDSIRHLKLSAQAGREEGEGINQSIKAVYGEPFFYQTLGYYLLPSILSAYGPPSDVLIAPFPDDPDYPSDAKIPFSIVLFYQDKGIFVEYILPREKTEENLVGCPTKADYLTVIVWPPNQNLSIETVAAMNDGLGMNDLNVDYFKTIENATSMTREDFYQLFKDPESKACVETQKNIWY